MTRSARFSSSLVIARDWPCATAFGNTHNNWQDLATRLNTALDEIEANLTTSFKGYDSQDSEVAGVVTQSVGGGSPLKL